MLAMCDKTGNVYASVPGLAHIANVSLTDCEAALITLLSPDKYSRTPEHEGRRIEPIDGGWCLLNHSKFRAIRSAEERREYMREYMRNKREAELLAIPLTELAKSTDVTPPAPSPDKSKEKKDQKKAALRAVSFATWIKTIPEGQNAIPDDHHVWRFAETAGIPEEFVLLAWRWFERNYATKPKRYTDWPGVFRKAVEGNWGDLWRINRDGGYYLTTAGEQLRRVMEAAA